MIRPAKIVCFFCLMVPAIALAQTGTRATNAAPRMETVIYKHVDESGRVTYANSPIKGGARVDLEPLTVIPSTPSGSLSAANAQVTSRVAPVATAPAVLPVLLEPTVPTVPTVPTAKPAVQVAAVLPLSSQSQKAMTPKTSPAPDNSVVASLGNISDLTEQRRADTRKHLLEGELQTELQLLAASRAKLSEEQKQSGGVRAMRASFAATSEAVTAQKPLISPETRAEIERHFERVRNLQDQVAMHENQLQKLREQLVALK